MAMKHLPAAERPDDQQAQLGEQRDHRSEERPDDVDAVVDLDHAMIAAAEPLDLAIFLGERLDDADAGNRVGQHAGHLAPGDARQAGNSAAAASAPNAPARR